MIVYAGTLSFLNRSERHCCSLSRRSSFTTPCPSSEGLSSRSLLRETCFLSIRWHSVLIRHSLSISKHPSLNASRDRKTMSRPVISSSMTSLSLFFVSLLSISRQADAIHASRISFMIGMKYPEDLTSLSFRYGSSTPAFFLCIAAICWRNVSATFEASYKVLYAVCRRSCSDPYVSCSTPLHNLSRYLNDEHMESNSKTSLYFPKA